MTAMAPLAGWYPDPTGAAAYRFWDGRQWTAALAAPMVVPIGAPPEPKDWCQRHPAWTTLIAFWVACMVWQWAWLARRCWRSSRWGSSAGAGTDAAETAWPLTPIARTRGR